MVRRYFCIPQISNPKMTFIAASIVKSSIIEFTLREFIFPIEVFSLNLDPTKLLQHS